MICELELLFSTSLFLTTLLQALGLGGGDVLDAPCSFQLMGGVIPEDATSVALRLGRVNELATDIAELCFEYVNSDPLDVRQRAVGGTTELFVHSVAPVPPAVGLMFSDAINQLRSSLDNSLMLALERDHSEPLTEQEERAVQFLIYGDEDRYLEAVARLVRRLPELSPEQPLGRRLYELQPFQPLERIRQMEQRVSTAGHGGHHLSVLQAYSNADKHRRPHVFATGNAKLGASAESTELMAEGQSDVRVGQVLARLPSADVDVVEMWPFVAVKRPTVGVLVPPGAELYELHRYVAEVAVPRLLDLGEVTLPPGVDLRALGCTDEERVAGAHGTYAHRAMGLKFRDRVAELDRRFVEEGISNVEVARREDEDELS